MKLDEEFSLATKIEGIFGLPLIVFHDIVEEARRRYYHRVGIQYELYEKPNSLLTGYRPIGLNNTWCKKQESN